MCYSGEVFNKFREVLRQKNESAYSCAAILPRNFGCVTM
nr:MAG TPA: hypothetical protein [Caudoviricetes sp.]